MKLAGYFSTALVLLLTGCAGVQMQAPEVTYKPVALQSLPGWGVGQASDVREAFAKSCEMFEKKDSAAPLNAQQPLFGTYGQWQNLCAIAVVTPNMTAFFEENFDAYEIVAGSGNSLFTGYYEASLRGSPKKGAEYAAPLYGLPKNYFTAKLDDFFPNSPEFHGKQLVGRVVGNKFVPHFNRAGIDKGAVEKDAEILLWVDDEVDAFFLQIQGSGRVEMPDGKVQHIGYAGANGHPYVAIGKYLIDKGDLTKSEMSMQRLRAWLKENPQRQREVLEQNPSYVFFTRKDDGPYGAQGVVLTPNRSLAVDRKFTPYGVPVYLDTMLTAKNDQPFQQLLVAQDTGGAIRGPVRGDIFFGYGDEAEALAGFQNAPGRLFVLAPKPLK